MVLVVARCQIQVNVLRSFLQLIEFLIRHIVILLRFLHVVDLSNHRHIQLLIDSNFIEQELLSLLDGLVVFLHVEEGDHLFVIVAIRHHPVPKLQNCLFVLDPVVGRIRRDVPPLSQNVVGFEAAEDGCPTRTNRIQQKPEFPVVLLWVFNLDLRYVLLQTLPTRCIL
jgi:hypothetical protein